MGLNMFIENWCVIERAWTYADKEEGEIDGNICIWSSKHRRSNNRKREARDQRAGYKVDYWYTDEGVIGKCLCKPALAVHKGARPESGRGDAWSLKAGSPRA